VDITYILFNILFLEMEMNVLNMGMKMGSGTNVPIQGGQNNHLTNDEI
jgi:hypothetical protein